MLNEEIKKNIYFIKLCLLMKENKTKHLYYIVECSRNC